MTAKWGDDAPEGSKYPAEYDLTIQSAVFAPDARYNNGETLLLQWTGTVSNVSDPNAEIPEWFDSLSFPIGNGWETEDGGKSVTHVETGQDKLFNRSSYAGKLVDACVKEFQISDLLESRGGPYEAKVWEGLTFRIGRKTFDFGSTIGEKVRSFPIRFVGVASDGPTSGTTQSVSVNNGADLKAAVTAIIKSSTDFTEAQAKAFNIPGVLEDADLLNSLMSEDGLYSSVKANA